MRSVEAAQRLDRGRASDPVDGHTDVALELRHRRLSQRAEDPVLRAGVEAELVEPVLKIAHVVASHRRLRMPQQAVAQREAGFDQSPPCIRTDDAVGGQSSVTLEGAHRAQGLKAEVTIDRYVGVGDASEALLEVGHGRAFIAEAD